MLDVTNEWIKNKPIIYRNKMGQYFTPNKMKEIIMSLLPNMDNANILEPSVGTGEFIPYIRNKFNNSNIDSYDIDVEILKLVDDSVNKMCISFLEINPEPKYDFVIGNPPYGTYFNPSIKNRFLEVISGRCNIYTLFIKQGIDSLKEGGYLAFVIPISMNSGSYFSKLREYIISKCEIEHIILFDDSEFIDAQQNVQILILRKTFNTGKNVFKIRDLTFFTKDYNRLYELTNGKKTLKECGYLAKTGTIVWNQHKLNLTTDNTKVKLIYSNNIKDGKLIEYKHPEKKQYIDTARESDIYPSIVVNRIVGKVGSINIKSAIVNEPFLGENHVNIIYPVTENVILIDKVYESLNSSETKEIFEKLIGNTQISKTELEYLVMFD